MLAAVVAMVATFFAVPTTVAADEPDPVTVELRQGLDDYEGAFDAYIQEDSPDTNHGTEDALLQVEGDLDDGALRSLSAWDVSSIPAGSTIESAAVTYDVTQTGATVQAFPLLRTWDEATVTWNAASPDNFWETPGAEGATDRGTTSIGGLPTDELGLSQLTFNEAGIDLVQSWVDAPLTNNGFVLISTSSTDTTWLRSSNNEVEDQRPTLSVTYVPPAIDVGGEFFGLDPQRVLDTRGPGADCVSSAGRDLLVVGEDIGVPEDASSVAMNVTVVGATAPGFLTVYPAGTTRPTASNINYTTGQTVPNLVTTSVGEDGQVSIYSSGGCPDVIVDITGFYTGGLPAPGGFVGLEPTRALDTRAAGVDCVSTSGADLTVSPQVEAGVPEGAVAVAMNVTVVGATAPGFLTVYPSGTDRPTASNLNYLTGQTVANHVTSAVGVDGAVSLYGSGGCPNVVVDILGYYTAGDPGLGGFVGIEPTRAADTRLAGQGGCVAGARQFAVAGDDTGIPADASAVVLNVTVAGSTAPGYLTVYPGEAEVPIASNLNYVAGQVVPNAVITRVDDGIINVFGSGGCPNVIIDVVGYHVGETLG